MPHLSPKFWLVWFIIINFIFYLIIIKINYFMYLKMPQSYKITKSYNVNYLKWQL